MPEPSVTDAFLSALSLRDFGRFADCLAPSAQARMLLPRGPEVRSGRDEIAQRFEGWFSHASDWQVLETRLESIGHRNRLSWRFRMSRNGGSKEVIEQVAFGRRLDLSRRHDSCVMTSLLAGSTPGLLRLCFWRLVSHGRQDAQAVGGPLV